MTTHVKSWSYSRYSDYAQCPLKFKLKHIDKIAEPKNPAMLRGAAIHELAEGYIKGTIPRLPPELKLLDKEFKKFKAQYKKKNHGMVVEDNWAFTKDWAETRWNDWAGCWLRIKLDCAHHEDPVTMVVTDWKTGKFRPELNEVYVEQLELYALAALILHEHIVVVKPRLAYIDLGVIYPGTGVELSFERGDIPVLKKLWLKRVKAMMSDKKFAPRPNNLCHWCFFRASNKAAGGGQCKY